jgi:tRNA1(Val) A37 N6-methylase TrmN6
LERQPAVADLARENAKLNNFSAQIKIITGDLRAPPPELSGSVFDWVLSNPPYWPAATHSLPQVESLAQAKFELTCTLEDVLTAAARFCRNGGRVGLIHLPERLTDLLSGLRRHHLEPKRLCLVSPKPGAPPHRVLIEAGKFARPGLKIEPPFVIHGLDGQYSSEMNEVYQGKPLSC